MKPRDGEFDDLRLAAKATDRGKAARQEWPAFKERLTQLGYSPRGIAHAFRTLSGPGTVGEALEVLHAPIPESQPVALSFEVTETRDDPSSANRVTIMSVERDDSTIHVNYEIVPPLGGSHQPQGEAKDDLGNDYRDLGGHFGITGSTDRTESGHQRCEGRLMLPLPPPEATTLRIRIRWEASVSRMPWAAPPSSIWESPAYEVRVSLPD